MSDVEESVRPLKALKMKKKGTDNEIEALKLQFKQAFSVRISSCFSGKERYFDVNHKRNTENTCFNQLLDA